MPDTIAIIPARGGSKGILGKNIRMLCGKPLISWTIEAAQQSASIGRVVVSTDSDEIGGVAKAFGAEVIWRPAAISGDAASSEEALIHALGYIKEKERRLPELLAFLQCTAPLTTSEDIDGTVEALTQNRADVAFSVTGFHGFLWRDDACGVAEGINHEKSVRLLRQQRERQYQETGAVYVMRTEGFMKAKHRFFGKTVMHETPLGRCIDIDEPVDLLIAEVLLRECRLKIQP